MKLQFFFYISLIFLFVCSFILFFVQLSHLGQAVLHFSHYWHKCYQPPDSPHKIWWLQMIQWKKRRRRSLQCSKIQNFRQVTFLITVREWLAFISRTYRPCQHRWASLGWINMREFNVLTESKGKLNKQFYKR